MITVEIELHDDDGEVWHRMSMPAEPTDVDGLAITPVVSGSVRRGEAYWLDCWAVTHIASGYHAGAGLCLACARTLAGRLGLLCINWLKPPPPEDPRMKEAKQLAIAALVDCDAHESREEAPA